MENKNQSISTTSMELLYNSSHVDLEKHYNNKTNMFLLKKLLSNLIYAHLVPIAHPQWMASDVFFHCSKWNKTCTLRLYVHVIIFFLLQQSISFPHLRVSQIDSVPLCHNALFMELGSIIRWAIKDYHVHFIIRVNNVLLNLHKFSNHYQQKCTYLSCMVCFL